MKSIRMQRWLRNVLATVMVVIPAVPALAHPGASIAVDRAGNVYFVDTARGVWKIDAAGALTFVGGSGFHWLALDESNRFARFARRTAQDEIHPLPISSPTVLISSDFPVAIVGDGLYFAPSGSEPLRLMRANPASAMQEVATVPDTVKQPGVQWLNGLTAATDGALYATVNDAVIRFGADQKPAFVARNVKPADCAAGPTLDAPPGPYLRGLAVGAAGSLYVASTGCHAVLRISPAGEVTTVLRADGGWSPTAVAFFKGDVYVLEYDHSAGQRERSWPPRVRKLSANGEVKTLATVSRDRGRQGKADQP